MIDLETLAIALHESGREAVLAGNTVAHTHLGEAARRFIEWEELSMPARNGRRQQAQWLLERFKVEERT